MHDGTVGLLLAQPYPPRRHKPRNLTARGPAFFETDQKLEHAGSKPRHRLHEFDCRGECLARISLRPPCSESQPRSTSPS